MAYISIGADAGQAQLDALTAQANALKAQNAVLAQQQTAYNTAKSKEMWSKAMPFLVGGGALVLLLGFKAFRRK
jgi:hypothetical protein